MGTSLQGEKDFPELDRLIRAFPGGSTIVFDIAGFDLFGYSYSKQTIRAALLLAKGDTYGSKYFLVRSPNRKYAEELSGALGEQRLAMLCSTSEDLSGFYDDYFVLGEINALERATLEYVIESKEATSSDVQRKFDITVQAASNRLSGLAAQRLVKWEDQPERKHNIRVCRRIDP